MTIRAHAGWGLAFVLASLGCGASADSERERGELRDSRTTTPENPGSSQPPSDTKEPLPIEPSNPSDGDTANIDIEDTDCAPIVPLSCEPIYAPREIPTLHALQAVGNLWLAEAIWDSGFVLFDEAGRASRELIQTGTLDRAAASSDDIHIATVDLEGVKARIYDREGVPLGEPFLLSSEVASEVAIEREGESSLVVWTTPRRVSVRAISNQGPMGEAFDLETDVWKDDFRVGMAASGDGEIAIAWSDRRVSDSHHRVFFVRANAEGPKGVVRVLFDSIEPHRVVDLKKTKKGYALLLEQKDHALLLPLTNLGDRDGPAYRFQGLSRLHGLAVHEGGEMLMAGLRKDGRDALRIVDSAGAPKDDWKCLEAYPSDGEHVVSLAEASTGFSVLYRSSIAQQLLLRIGGSSAGESE